MQRLIPFIGNHLPTAPRAAAWATAALLFGAMGCQEDRSPPPPPPQLGPPVVYSGPVDPAVQPKPLPDPRRAELPPPPFDDAPLIGQRIPEAQEFVRAYNAVGRPRIAIFVNRTLDGEVVPPAGNVTEHSTHTERSSNYYPGGSQYHEEHVERTLKPGEYDEAGAKSIDYAAIELRLTDWLASDGQVTVISPATVRERLTDEQVAELQRGRPRVMADVRKNLNAQILVQVQAHPTRQTPQGLEIRLIAEAIEIDPRSDGASIGRASVLIPPPLTSETINQYTRFVARKLMSDMTMTWSTPSVTPRGGDVPPPPGTPPADGPTTTPLPGVQSLPPEQPAPGSNNVPPPSQPRDVPPDAPLPPSIPPERPSLLDRDAQTPAPAPQPPAEGTRANDNK